MKCLHIIKKSVAREHGLRYYAIAKLCPGGHFSERWVSGGSCVSCRDERAVRDADYIKQRDLEYRTRAKDKILATKRAYYAKNRDSAKEYLEKYRKENPEKCKKWQRDYYLRNSERIKKTASNYRAENPALISALKHARRAKIKMSEGSHDKDDILNLLSKQKEKCASCGERLKTSGNGIYHVDHIYPISKGGSNWPSNLQLLCPTCNLRKNAKDPLEWAKENGKLL